MGFTYPKSLWILLHNFPWPCDIFYWGEGKVVRTRWKKVLFNLLICYSSVVHSETMTTPPTQRAVRRSPVSWRRVGGRNNVPLRPTSWQKLQSLAKWCSKIFPFTKRYEFALQNNVHNTNSSWHGLFWNLTGTGP